MVQEKVDRRVRKTKALLLKGLTELMQEKDIKDISVKELSDLVDLNRGTFYLHYRDIYDMLEKIEDKLFQEFDQILDRNFSARLDTSPYPVFLDIFTYLDQNRQIARALLGPHGDLAFLNRLKLLVKERFLHLWEQHSLDKEYFDYFYAFLVSGCIGLIETWLKKDDDRKPEAMAQLASEIIFKGIGEDLER